MVKHHSHWRQPPWWWQTARPAPGAQHVEDDIHNSPSQHDSSNNDINVPKDHIIIDFDSLDNSRLVAVSPSYWQDLHDGNKTCMQSSYWELILENGQWLGCWITDRLCALPVTGWTGIHGFGYFSPLIRIAPFSAHKLIRQDTAVLHQAIIV
jgi:hypothetical protein